MNGKEKKLKKKIIRLNQAWGMIESGLGILKEEYPRNKDLGYWIWEIAKVNEKIHRYLVKKFRTQRINEEFWKLVDKLEEIEDK